MTPEQSYTDPQVVTVFLLLFKETYYYTIGIFFK